MGTSTDQRCSFCRRLPEDVDRLIKASDKVYICNNCVELCVKILYGDHIELAMLAKQSIIPTSIFISYSSINRDLVTLLSNDLQILESSIWFDRELTRRGGIEWWKTILEKIRECNLFIYAITPISIKSRACQREYDYALALEKRILPLMIERTPLRDIPLSVQKFQIIDYCTQDKEQLSNLITTLLKLPAPKPLPDPLPLEPEVPFDPVTVAASKVKAPTLDYNEQKQLIRDLEDLSEEEDYATEVRALLDQLLRRDDLAIRSKDMIERLKKSLEQ